MKKFLILLVVLVLTSVILISCNWAKEKTKNAITKTGEAVGKTGSEFGSAVYNGVKKTFDNKIQISEELTKAGLEIGEVLINSTDTTANNVLTIYTIFNKNLDETIRIKVINESGKEYGRVSENIKGEKGDARYIDFTFDSRVNIGSKGSISIEKLN